MMKTLRLIFILLLWSSSSPLSASIVSLSGDFASLTPLSPYPDTLDFTFPIEPGFGAVIALEEFHGLGSADLDSIFGTSLSLDSLATPGKTYSSTGDLDVPGVSLGGLGITVDSHLLHVLYSSGLPSFESYSGSVTFDDYIVGFFLTETSLFATDQFANLVSTTPPTFFSHHPSGATDGRGLEPWETLGGASGFPALRDTFSISPDGKTLNFTFSLTDDPGYTEFPHAAQVDELRIITSATLPEIPSIPLPGTAWLLLSGLLTGVFAIRKKKVNHQR